MKTNLRVLQRIAYTLAATGLLLVAAYPALRPSVASAAQLSQRSITLSDSGPSGGTISTGIGSGTNVTYKVGFTTSAAAQSLVIDFCKEAPIIGDACTIPGSNPATAPTRMDAASAALVGVTGNITTAGWSITATGSQVKLTKASGSAATVGAQVFSLTGIKNPDTTGSYYARIYTFTNNTYGTYASPTSPGGYVDYGGIALSTNQIITITARVQEQLTFCVSGAAQATWTTAVGPSVSTDDCSTLEASTAPALTLGHGAPTKTLDATATDTGTVYSQLSTNATSGAVVAMRNSNTTCGGLSADGGTTCAIPATASGVGTPASAITFGTAAFGMHVENATAGPGGTGTLTADTNYNNGASTYGMDTETVTDPGSVTGTYGDRVVYCTAPVYRMNNFYQFAATASLTTPAGIYTANMDLIATGTF